MNNFIKKQLLIDCINVYENGIKYIKNAPSNLESDIVSKYLTNNNLHAGLCTLAINKFKVNIYEGDTSWMKKYRSEGYYWAQNYCETQSNNDIIINLNKRLDIIKQELNLIS